jgi:uncharacterized protein (DUF2249 family)
MSWGASGLIVDARGFDPALRRPVLFAIVDKFVETGCEEQIVFICDHEPAGIGFQIDLRRETRGRFQFEYDQRSDGAWVACIKLKAGSEA